MAAVYLRHAGDAGLEGEYAFLGFLVFFHFVRQVRARSDETHVAEQNVEKLGKFVDIEPSENFSYSGNARIVLDLEERPVGALVFLYELGFQFVGIRAHRAEFEHREGLAKTPYPDAAVHRRMEIRKPDRECGKNENRREGDDETGGNDDVEYALQHPSPWTEADAYDLHERNPGDERNLGSSGFVQEKTVGVPVCHAVRSGDFENLFEIGLRKIGIQRDDFFEFPIPASFDNLFFSSEIRLFNESRVGESYEFISRIRKEFGEDVGGFSSRKYEDFARGKAPSAQKRVADGRETVANERNAHDRHGEGEKYDEARDLDAGQIPRTQIREREEVQKPRKRNRNRTEESFDPPIVVVGDAVRTAEEGDENVERRTGRGKEKQLRLGDSLDGELDSRNEVGDETYLAAGVERAEYGGRFYRNPAKPEYEFVPSHGAKHNDFLKGCNALTNPDRPRVRLTASAQASIQRIPAIENGILIRAESPRPQRSAGSVERERVVPIRISSAALLGIMRSVIERSASVDLIIRRSFKSGEGLQTDVSGRIRKIRIIQIGGDRS